MSTRILSSHTTNQGTLIEYIPFDTCSGQYSVFITIPRVVSAEQSKAMFENLLSIDDWRKGERMGLPIQRLQKWYHDDGKYFSPNWLTQTHQRWTSNPTEHWIPELRHLIQRRIVGLFETELLDFPELLECCNCPNMNSTLINHYRDGSDFIKYHTDDERLFGTNPTIAMLTFGHPRPLRFRPKSPTDPHLSFSNQDGDLFLMLGCVQKQFVHGIERDPTIVEPRFSITFREHRG